MKPETTVEEDLKKLACSEDDLTLRLHFSDFWVFNGSGKSLGYVYENVSVVCKGVNPGITTIPLLRTHIGAGVQILEGP